MKTETRLAREQALKEIRTGTVKLIIALTLEDVGEHEKAKHRRLLAIQHLRDALLILESKENVQLSLY